MQSESMRRSNERPKEDTLLMYRSNKTNQIHYAASQEALAPPCRC